MDPWVDSAAARIAQRAERDLEDLVAVSSPSGDVAGAERAVAIASAAMPPGAKLERWPCSTPGCAPDLCARLHGEGAAAIVLLGHLDTVVSHAAHRPLERDGEHLVGSGTIDMKGGVALALGVLAELAAKPELYAELALLLVCDEEWRTRPLAHAHRFAGFDACLCFEAGERTAAGDDAVIVKRKAAGTLRVRAQGRAAHSGAAPERGRSALLALAEVARRVDAGADPEGPDRLTAVPTILHAGGAFNVVPAEGELTCDLRADSRAAFDAVLDSIPGELDEVALACELVRSWPGMDAREAAAGPVARAAERLGRPLVGAERGGASDASHMAEEIALTIDGLGPRGGAAHNPDEWLRAESLGQRAEVALALALTLLDDR
jgi:glutamate carboxypeptidase